MKISEETVDHIAHLARLEFQGEEKVKIQEDMNKIIGFMEQLTAVNTDEVEPLIFLSEEVNVLREDEPATTISQQEALQNAPKKDSDYFRIPKVLNNK